MSIKHQDEPLFARAEAVLTKEVEQEISEARERVLANIARHDLWRNAVELDINGFTVIPPEQVGPPGFADSVCNALLETSARDTGVRPDAINGSTHSDILSRHGQVELIEPLIHRHPLFQEALLNERALALVTYLLGESCGLLSSSGQIKGPGKHYLPLHSDQGLTYGPEPLPLTAHVCNAVWVLSDYTADNGATCLVPGSHKLCRNPTLAEIQDLSLYQPLEAKAGSILIWHGNTWHGALPRKNPGLRIGIIQYFGRGHLNRGHLSKLFTKEQFTAAPPRFSRLMGVAGENYLTASLASKFSPFC